MIYSNRVYRKYRTGSYLLWNHNNDGNYYYHVLWDRCGEHYNNFVLIFGAGKLSGTPRITPWGTTKSDSPQYKCNYARSCTYLTLLVCPTVMHVGTYVSDTCIRYSWLICRDILSNMKIIYMHRIFLHSYCVKGKLLSILTRDLSETNPTTYDHVECTSRILPFTFQYA